MFQSKLFFAFQGICSHASAFQSLRCFLVSQFSTDHFSGKWGGVIKPASAWGEGGGCERNVLKFCFVLLSPCCYVTKYTLLSILDCWYRDFHRSAKLAFLFCILRSCVSFFWVHSLVPTFQNARNAGRKTSNTCPPLSYRDDIL